MDEFNGLTFDRFRDILLQCRDLCELNDAVYHAMDHYADRYKDFAEFYFPTPVILVIELLSIIMKDTEEWISYWFYDLDCGQKATDDTVTSFDGEPIPIRTPRDLWNLLVEDAENGA